MSDKDNKAGGLWYRRWHKAQTSNVELAAALEFLILACQPDADRDTVRPTKEAVQVGRNALANMEGVS